MLVKFKDSNGCRVCVRVGALLSVFEGLPGSGQPKVWVVRAFPDLTWVVPQKTACHLMRVMALHGAEGEEWKRR